MNVSLEGLLWLWKHHPLLSISKNASKVAGILEVSAHYDRDAGQVLSGRHLTVQTNDTFIADRFSISIELDIGGTDAWPKVYETGLRHRTTASRNNIPVRDLHFYPTGEACLGFDYPWDPPLTLEYFLSEIVEPFFYRLAYVDLYGLAATRNDLWPEHSHGIIGLIEHQEDVRRGPGALRSSRDREEENTNAQVSRPTLARRD